jgi:hypothetical protein
MQASVVSAFAADRGSDAAALVFEYMAATLACMVMERRSSQLDAD